MTELCTEYKNSSLLYREANYLLFFYRWTRRELNPRLPLASHHFHETSPVENWQLGCCYERRAKIAISTTGLYHKHMSRPDPHAPAVTLGLSLSSERLP